MVQIKATVVRGGHAEEIAIEEIVPGDLVILNAGDSIPGQSRILESKDLFVDEAALTGETYPVEKTAGVLPGNLPLSKDECPLFRDPCGERVREGGDCADRDPD